MPSCQVAKLNLTTLLGNRPWQPAKLITPPLVVRNPVPLRAITGYGEFHQRHAISRPRGPDPGSRSLAPVTACRIGIRSGIRFSLFWEHRIEDLLVAELAARARPLGRLERHRRAPKRDRQQGQRLFRIADFVHSPTSVSWCCGSLYAQAEREPTRERRRSAHAIGADGIAPGER